MWEKWAEKELSSGECQGFIEVEEVEATFSEEAARRGGPWELEERLGVRGTVAAWLEMGKGGGLTQERETEECGDLGVHKKKRHL